MKGPRVLLQRHFLLQLYNREKYDELEIAETRMVFCRGQKDELIQNKGKAFRTELYLNGRKLFNEKIEMKNPKRKGSTEFEASIFKKET